MKTTVSSFFCAMVLTLSFCGGATGADLVDELVVQAVADGLHREKYWHLLLHYQEGLSGFKSRVDDPDFFLSGNGKTDPRSELEATLRAFFQSDREKARQALCRFTARYVWLKERLGFSDTDLPYDGCENFDATMDRLDPDAAVLIFPSAYLNSPASMFGHTLIRIDSAGTSRLLSHAVNYAATGEDANGLLFAVKGIFGLYPGYFSILPYYEKVKEYGDLDHRDIWEYPLDLSRAEVRKMMLHLWELQEIHSDYYFFDENCSYTLLFLLDTARPSLDLTKSCRPWVIPVDTIRQMAKKNLFKEVVYRPSKATQIKHMMDHMDARLQGLALAIYRGERSAQDPVVQSLDPVSQVKVLDLILAYVQYGYARKDLSRERYLEIFMDASRARSRLPQTGTGLVKITTPFRPDKGHASNRFGMGFGILKGGDRFRDHAFFQEISIRPAYHDLLSSDRGYVKGSQIEFMNLMLRYFPQKRRIMLEKLDMINIFSISARDRFFKPVSWKVSTGFFRQSLPHGKRGLFYKLSVGGGYAYDLAVLGTAYFLAEAELDISGRIKNAVCFGLGAEAGILKPVSEKSKLHLFFRPLYFVPGDTHTRFEWEMAYQYSVSRNTALSLSWQARHIFDHFESAAVFSLYRYF